MERLLPQNIEAEQALLGSIIIDPESHDLVVDVVRADDFYRDAHRLIYQTMMSLVRQDVEPDYVAVCDEMERTGKIKEVGKIDGVDGPTYIMSLINKVPTSGNAEYYANMVARTAANRRLAHAAGMIAQLAYDQDAKSLEKAEQILFSLQRNTPTRAFVPMLEGVNEYMGELNDVHGHRGTCTGIETGYKDVDDTLNGLQRSDLILLGGRPGSGKTSMGLCMGYNAALRGSHVAVFSLEMSRRQLIRRMMSMASKVDLQRLRSGWIDDHEWETIVGKADDLSKLPIWINDAAGNPIASMRSQLRRLIQETGKIDLVVIDYLGLIGSDEQNESENRVQEVSKISWGLKKLAREFDVPVLALAQLSRGVESRQNKRPMLSDLRDSGSLEQDADVVMFLYREDYYAEQEKRKDYTPDNLAELSIAKHRNGPIGGVVLHFQSDQTMFYNLDYTQK